MNLLNKITDNSYCEENYISAMVFTYLGRYPDMTEIESFKDKLVNLDEYVKNVPPVYDVKTSIQHICAQLMGKKITTSRFLRYFFLDSLYKKISMEFDTKAARVMRRSIDV
jgi:hypothetical protein